MKDVISVDSILDETGEILFTFGAKVGSSPDKVFVGKDNIDWAKSQLHSLLISKLPEIIDVGKYDLDCPPADLHRAAGYNSAIYDMRKSIAEMFEVKG